MMQTARRLILFSLVATVLASVVFLTRVSADGSPTTDAQLTRIRTNCVSAKNRLNQVHAADGLLRVNRGQIYESMTTKLMSRFNNRVSTNNFDASALVTITNNYNSALATFRTDYITYEQQLSSAMQIDCTNEPISFYDAIATARISRSQVHTDVIMLHQYIDSYAVAFNAFTNNFVLTKTGSN
jgi:hypothetical protein